MADTPDKPKTSRPESPTTARELDWDDDDAPSSPKLGRSTGEDVSTNTTVNPATSTSGQTRSPALTADPRQQAESTLREAFPAIDAAVVKAVLVASGGQLEPAFNALLSMSDPSAAIEPTPPVQPPRRAPQADLTPAQRQMLQDEQYARQLAEHYNAQSDYRSRGNQSGYRGQDGYEQQAPRLPRRPGQDDMYDDRERSFIDDDLPVIRDNIKKGFLETQKKAMGFIDTLRKQFDGDESDDERPPPPPPRKPNQTQGQAYPRRSGDRDRYDADPQVLGDDFSKLHLQDESTPARTSTSSRPAANPDLFRSSTPKDPNRRVSFQDPDEDLYSGPDSTVKRPSSTSTPVSTSKSSKWQPMAAVDPDPIQEHDPFSLGDSDDDAVDTGTGGRPGSAGDKKKDVKPEDTERLKRAVEESMNESLADTSKDLQSTKLTPDGNKDATAVEKVTKP